MDFNKNITLKQRSSTSILDNLVLYEPIDLNILNKLISSDLLRTINNPLAKDIYSTEKEQLLNYKKLQKNLNLNLSQLNLFKKKK